MHLPLHDFLSAPKANPGEQKHVLVLLRSAQVSEQLCPGLQAFVTESKNGKD